MHGLVFIKIGLGYWITSWQSWHCWWSPIETTTTFHFPIVSSKSGPRRIDQNVVDVAFLILLREDGGILFEELRKRRNATLQFRRRAFQYSIVEKVVIQNFLFDKLVCYSYSYRSKGCSWNAITIKNGRLVASWRSKEYVTVVLKISFLLNS